MSRIRSWLALVLVCLAPVIVLEGGLRIFRPLPGPPAGAESYHRFLPGWNQSGTPPVDWAYAYGPLNGVSPNTDPVRVNRYGFLYPEERGQRRSAKELRIAVLGGSTVECIALRPENRWPAVLERLLGEALPGRSVAVLNLGISDQGTWTHLANVAQHLPTLAPDLTILMLGANDLIRSRGDYEHLLMGNSVRSMTGPGLFARAKYYVRDEMQLGRYIQKARFGGQPYFSPSHDLLERLPELPSKPSFKPEALDDYENAMVSIAALAQAHGSRVYFTTQPMLWKQENSPEEEAVFWLLKGEYEGRPYRRRPGDSASLLETLNARLLDTCERRGYPCLDLAGSIPRSLGYFYDDVHFNDAGARLVAEQMAEALLASGVIGVGDTASPGSG
ncbi:MAG: hypothetical protein GY772_04735 [bacterium]|nr:hypothetical protein [bacterium]